MTARPGVVKGHGDLAVGPLAQSPAVLVRHPDRVRTALREASVIEDEHTSGRAEVFGQKGAVAGEHLLVVPGALTDELLERRLGIRAGEVRWKGDASGDGLDALALTVGEESLEVHPGPTRGLGLREVRCEVRGVPSESFQDRRI